MFALKHSLKESLTSDLTIMEDDISIESTGKGKQCFIKTEFALNRASDKLDFVLIEEPENHQSHINMKKLINLIDNNNESQLFITYRADLINVIIKKINTTKVSDCETIIAWLNKAKSYNGFYILGI